VTVDWVSRSTSAIARALRVRQTSECAPYAIRLKRRCTIARYTAEDPYSGLVDPEALARDIPDLDLDHPWALAPEEAIELAKRCEAAGLAVDSRITNSEGASVNTHRHIGVYGQTRSGFWPAPRARAIRSVARS